MNRRGEPACRLTHWENSTEFSGALENAPKEPAEHARHVATLAGLKTIIP
jgi:hypothetical protein